MATPDPSPTSNPTPPQAESSPAPKPAPAVTQIPTKKRRWTLFLLAIIIMGAITSAGTMYALNRFFIPKSHKDAAATTFSFKAKVVYVTGFAWKMTDGRRVEIKEGDILNEQDELSTENDSRLVIAFDDESVVRIGEQTTITLLTLKPDQMTIEEKRGVLFARVHKDESHIFQIKAGVITVQSLGTAFAVENQDEVKVKVFENKVKVISDSKTETAVGVGQKWQESVAEVKPLTDSEVTANQFLSWSLLEDAKKSSTSATPKPPPAKQDLASPGTPTPKTTNTPTPTILVAAGFTLSASTADNGISLSWQTDALDVAHGFKVMKSLKADPTFPKDSAVYKDQAVRSFVWEIKDGQTWHIRICQYTSEGTCGAYSNEVTVKAPTGTTSGGFVKSISLIGEKISSSEVKLRWTVDGNSPKGYKEVWSKNSGPTYPTRDGDQFHYDDTSSIREYTINGLESGKTYYFRVCEYLGSYCGTYSSEVTVSL
jgi:FecR protein